MMLNRVLMLAVFFAACPSWATPQDGRSATAGRGDLTASTSVAAEQPITLSAKETLKPRRILPKQTFVTKPAGESRLAIKFRDEVKARAMPDKSLALLGADDDMALTAVVQQFGLRFVPAINSSQEQLDALQARAAAYSGKQQPDLGGLMYIEGQDNLLQAAANMLVNLDSVEYVYFQLPLKPASPVGLPGACCVAGFCSEQLEQDCINAGGIFIVGETCTATICDTGACCNQANCTDTIEGLCTGAGEVFFTGASCSDVPAPCEAVTGACCLPAGGCSFGGVTQADCDVLGGVFHPNMTCIDVQCPGPPGACCIYPDPVNCQDLSPEACADAGGVWRPGDCETEQCDFECGDADLASCFEVHAYPFCNDEECCELVGGFRPFCINEEDPLLGEWDDFCVAIANYVCDNNPLPDRCHTPFSGNCFEPHTPGGCFESECCDAVCDFDPFCCEGAWDDGCVLLAYELCDVSLGGQQTPDLTAYQGYLRSSGWGQQLNGVPPKLPQPPSIKWEQGPARFSGEGMYLFDEWGLKDIPAMPAPLRFGGLYGLGRQFQEVYGIGTSNLARGAGVKVAVIEWAYYQNHEDLNVIPEPGQTMIMTPSISIPWHGTACLGIIGAKDNGFGMVGVAPDAEMYFFPLLSVEEGSRWLSAFTSAYSTLGPGDVLSFSVVAPSATCTGGSQNGDPFGNLMAALGTDLGITVLFAAGDDCCNLDDVDGLGDSGAIVVGACTPGAPYCRLTRANYFRDAADSGVIHLSAWGETVATTGGAGELFPSPSNFNVNRSYTTRFSGTSAATPQVAGVVACMQGLSKQFYGIPQTPARIRSILMATSFRQCGVPPADLLGFSTEVTCGPDTSPDGEPNRINGFVQPRAAGDYMFSSGTTGFDEAPNIEDVYILRGNFVYGNRFSVKALDNNFLVVQSLYTHRGFVPQLNLPPGSDALIAASKVKYFATGYTTDLMVRAKSPVKSPSALTIEAVVGSGDPISFAMIEMYDWVLNRWIFVGFTQLPGPLVFTVADGSRFINQATRNVYFRLYVFGAGGVSPDGSGNLPNGGTATRVDFLNLTPTLGDLPIPQQ